MLRQSNRGLRFILRLSGSIVKRNDSLILASKGFDKCSLPCLPENILTVAFEATRPRNLMQV